MRWPRGSPNATSAEPRPGSGPRIRHSSPRRSLIQEKCGSHCPRTTEAASVVRGQWEPHFSWISDRLGELWRMRGPDPGLGSALVAFGLPRGHRIAYELSRFAGENESLWQHM